MHAGQAEPDASCRRQHIRQAAQPGGLGRDADAFGADLTEYPEIMPGQLRGHLIGRRPAKSNQRHAVRLQDPADLR